MRAMPVGLHAPCQGGRARISWNSGRLCGGKVPDLPDDGTACRAQIADTMDRCAEALKPEGLSELADDLADWRRCLEHLCSSPAEVYRGGMKKPVGYYVAAAAGRADPDSAPTEQMDPAEAQRALGTLGLRAMRDGDGWWLAVANAHSGLQAIYRDTHWTGMSGTTGVWVQAMKRVPDTRPAKSNLRFANVATRCGLVPLDQVLGKLEKLDP